MGNTERFSSGVEAQPREWEILKHQILNNLPRAEQGLNIFGIKSFLKELGLPAKPLVVLDSKGVKALRDLALQFHYQEDFFSSVEFGGAFLSELDVCIVDRNWVEYNSPDKEWIEGVCVHELAHGTRSGYADEEAPPFWEEGFADYIRIRFLERQRQKPKQVPADLPRAGKHLASASLPRARYRLPEKYGYKDAHNAAVFQISAAAGYGVELLCRRNPRLFPSLCRSRQTPSALAEVRREVDSVQPGLYEKLARLPLTEDAFMNGLGAILKAEESAVQAA